MTYTASMTNTPLIRPSVHLLVSKLSVNHLQEKHDQTDHGKASSSSVRKHKDRIKVLKDQEKSLYGLGVGLGAYGISPLAEGVSKSPNIVGLDKPNGRILFTELKTYFRAFGI